MGDSTTNLSTISQAQQQKEVTANGLYDALSPSSFFGRKDDSANLTWSYYGAKLDLDGVLTTIANGTIALTPSVNPTWIQGGRVANATQAITAISKAGSAVITIGASHGRVVGEVVFIASVVGMTEINNVFGGITATGATTITVDVASTAFTTYTSGGTIQLVTDIAASAWKQGKGLAATPEPGLLTQYQLNVGASSVSSYTDWRKTDLTEYGDDILRKAMSDADQVLTAIEARCNIREYTGTLTAGRNIIVPLPVKQSTEFNNTTGGFALTFKTPGGTGIAVAAGKRAIVYSDGTNVVRVTADT